jgi:P27 family predicted phage terminase small subunit
MARGRPPLPEKAAWLKGDPSNRRYNTIEPAASGIPVAPRHLDKVAKAEWKSIVALLTDMGVIGAVDGKALGLYCECYSRYRAACDYVKRNGAYNAKGNPNGATKDIHVCINQLRAWLVEFGCTSAARARMRLPAREKPKSDKWAEILPMRGSGPRGG